MSSVCCFSRHLMNGFFIRIMLPKTLSSLWLNHLKTNELFFLSNIQTGEHYVTPH
jgi:hypothetical protein